MLRGRVEERDAGLVARALEPRGVEVARVVLVGDDREGIAEALRSLLAGGADLVCVTGGLGPTHDDVTMEAVAAATGRPLRLDPEALRLVDERSAGRRAGPAARRAAREKQASLPEGSVVLPPAGVAPGCVLRHGGALVAVLPGPPWELGRMLGEALDSPPLAELLERARPPRERVLRIHGMREAELVEVLEGHPAARRAELRLGICARDAELELTVRHGPGGEGAAAALEGVLRDALGPALFSRDGRDVDAMVAGMLVAASQTVAVAESCTGGGLGARLTGRPGSSAYVLGGVIAYADAAKEALLGVRPATLRLHGAVSAECAREMAAGARARLRSDWSLSVTGIAGPGGGSPEKPVGLVYLGISGPGGTRAEEHRLRGDREAVRARSSALALHLLRRALEGGGP